MPPSSTQVSSRHDPGAARSAGESKTVAAVERAADVLLVFATTDQQWWGITDIARTLDMPKAAVHRILASLRTRGIITIDEETRRYALGPSMVTLGLTALSGIEIRRRAQGELTSLSAATEETATLSIRNGDTRMYVDQVTPRREVIMSVNLGVPYPLHAGSSSKAFLAFLPEAEIDAYLAGTLEAVTEVTKVDPVQIKRDLDRIRKRGWAESNGERQTGAASIAAPVYDHEGHPVAVLSVCGPDNRFRTRRGEVADQLLSVTQKLSTEIGYRGAVAR